MAISFLAAACGADDPVSAPVPTAAAGSLNADQVVGSGATRPLVLTDAGATPPLDSTMSSVDLSSVELDTFGSGLVPLNEADDATIASLRDLISPIDAPIYESVAAASEWIPADDIVVTYQDDDGNAWAYPVRTLNFHEIVNDELAGRPLLISYCPLCASGVVYDRRVGNRVLSFSNTSALHQADLVMVDRETGSFWWQVAGRSIIGPLTNTELQPLPSTVQRWSDWSVANPGGAVMARLPGEQRLPDPFLGLAQRINNGLTPIQVDEAILQDPRLSPGATAVAVSVDGAVLAWPVSPARTAETKFGDRILTINADGVGATVTDAVTGERLPTRTSLWFALVASFPGVEIAGESSR